MTCRHRPQKTLPAAILAVLFSLPLFLSGCKAEIPIVSELSEGKTYTLPQSMLIAATERSRYEQLYTSQIWAVELQTGQTFDSYVLEQVKEFLKEMKLLNLLAQTHRITLTSAEKEEVRKAAAEYFDSLTEDDHSYMGATEQDVQLMYENYCLSNKIVNELTKDMNLEISDSEAKVIAVRQIVLSSETLAKEALSKAGEEGTDFLVIAREYSEDGVIERKLSRGEAPGPCETAAFELSEGQLSPVVEENGKYYIMKCVDDYDEKATKERKAGLYLERKKEAFDQIYSRFKEENPVSFSEDIWKNVSLSGMEGTGATGFFEIYRKYFP